MTDVTVEVVETTVVLDLAGPGGAISSAAAERAETAAAEAEGHKDDAETAAVSAAADAASLNDRLEQITGTGEDLFIVTDANGLETLKQDDDGTFRVPNLSTGEMESVQAAMENTPIRNDGERLAFAWTDANDKRLFSIDPTTGAVEMAGLEGDLQTAVATLQEDVLLTRTPRAFADYTAGPATLPPTMGRVDNGQSNNAGANGQAAITLTAKYPDLSLTFNDGPKSDPDAAETSMVSLIPLVEDDETGDGSDGRGETALSATVNGFLERQFMRDALPLTADNYPVQISGTVAFGGQSFGSMLGDKWVRFETIVERMFDLGGVGFQVLVVDWNGHEANQNTASRTACRDSALLAVSMVRAEIAGYGQTVEPIVMFPQKSWGAAVRVEAPNEDYSAGMTLGILDARGDGVFVTHPDYCAMLRGDCDGIHSGPMGRQLEGHYRARVEDMVLVQKKEWRDHEAIAAWWRGGYCFVRLAPPVAPVVIDYDELGPATQAGFKIEDDSGDNPILAIERLSDGVTLRLTPSRQPDGEVELRIGLDFLPSKCGLSLDEGEQSAGTNIRDSDVDPITFADGTTHSRANYLTANKLAVQMMDV